jgi:hypothetical protein
MVKNYSKLKLVLGSIGVGLVGLGLGLAVLLTSNGKPALQPTETANLESAKPPPDKVTPPSPTAEPALSQALSPTVTPAQETELSTPTSGLALSLSQNTPEPTSAPTQEVEKTVKPPLTAMPGPPDKNTPTNTRPPALSPANSTPIIATTTAPAPSANSPQSWQGVINSISANTLSLSNYSEPILLTSATKITMGGANISLKLLKVGQRVTVQVVRNAQGQFVAQAIMASLLPPPKSGPPK